MLRAAALLIFAAATGALPPPPAGRLAAVPGTCAFTRVRQVIQRLEDGRTHEVIANSGSAIVLANGVYGVSYDQVPAVNRARVGDPVMTCLAKLPRHCPPGDGRGKWYTTTDLRSDEAWTLPDSEHGCGGA
jgi:hypothetical protein